MSTDDVEYRKLAELVAHPEQFVKELQLPNTVATELANLRLRLEKLESEGFVAGSEKERTKNHRHSESVAIAQLVAKETRLNEKEKAAYAFFLQKAYFTNEDVAALNEFHRESWNKLSDAGKAEIAQRVEKGIERGELNPSLIPELYSDITEFESQSIDSELASEIQDKNASDLLGLSNFGHITREK